MNNIVDTITKAVAKFYNAIPGDIKIIIFPALFTLVISYLTLATDFLKNLLINATPEQIPLITFAIVVIVGIIGYIQKKIANQGERVLVQEGDKATVAKIENKIEENKELLKNK